MIVANLFTTTPFYSILLDAFTFSIQFFNIYILFFFVLLHVLWSTHIPYFVLCNERHEPCECSLACSCNTKNDCIARWLAENTCDMLNVLHCRIEDNYLITLGSFWELIINEAIFYIRSCFLVLLSCLKRKLGGMHRRKLVCYRIIHIRRDPGQSTSWMFLREFSGIAFCLLRRWNDRSRLWHFHWATSFERQLSNCYSTH